MTDDALTIDEYLKICPIKTCRWCDHKVTLGPILYYPHKGGWAVRGMAEKQWLYRKCPKCDYDWSLWKLGVSRE